MEAPVGLLLEDALVEEAPHGLDGVERDALGALHDAQPRRWRQARHESVQELADDLVGERVERQRRDRTAGQAETSAVGPLRSRQHEQEEGVVAGPLQQVVQESDQAGVCPLQVLDHEHDRKVLRQSFEEEPPAREELLSSRSTWEVGRPSSWPRRGAMNSRSAGSGIQRSSPVRSRSETSSCGSSSLMSRRARTISDRAQ